MGHARPVILSWSGGKDSTLALERLRGDPEVEIVGLVTTVSTDYQRISIHGVRRALLHRQVASIGAPLTEIALGASPSNATYEAALGAALAELQSQHSGLHTIAFGDLFLEEVRSYRDALLARLGWTGLYPLWGEPTGPLADYCIGQGYRAVLTCVDTTQLAGTFAGREFDRQLLADLPASVDPCGERGEFHTFVYAGPLFRNVVNLQLGEQVLREERFQYCDLLDAGAHAGASAPA
jgi:uncharacterized protein (TIGR00290 family)